MNARRPYGAGGYGQALYGTWRLRDIALEADFGALELEIRARLLAERIPPAGPCTGWDEIPGAACGAPSAIAPAPGAWSPIRPRLEPCNVR